MSDHRGSPGEHVHERNTEAPAADGTETYTPAPPPTASSLSTSGHRRSSVTRGLGTSKKPERICSLNSTFPVFNILFSFCFFLGQSGGGGGGGYLGGVISWLLFLFLVSPGLQGMVQTILMMIIIIIMIIIILIIVTCIHSIFVERQREKVPPTYYNKGPNSTSSPVTSVCTC